MLQKSTKFAEIRLEDLIRQNPKNTAKSSCRSRNMRNKHLPPAVEKLFLRVDTAESGPSRMCYLPTPDPSAQLRKQPCFRLGRGGRCGRSRSRVTAAAALHREEAGEADDEEVEGADGHLGSDV